MTDFAQLLQQCAGGFGFQSPAAAIQAGLQVRTKAALVGTQRSAELAHGLQEGQ